MCSSLYSELLCSFLLPAVLSPVSLYCHPPVLSSVSVYLFISTFSFWNVEPLIIALSIKTFLSVSLLSFSCGALARMLSHILTRIFSVFFSLLSFPGLWSTGSSAPGLRVSGHHPSNRLCWTPRCRLKYAFCFVGLKTMFSCLLCETYILMKQHV